MQQLPKEAVGLMEEIAGLRKAYDKQYDLNAAIEYPRYPDIPTPDNFNDWVQRVNVARAEAQPYLDNMKGLREREEMLRRQLRGMMTFCGAQQLLHAGLWFRAWDMDEILSIDEAN